MYSSGINYGRLRLLQKIIQTHWNIPAEKKSYNFNEVIFLINALLESEGKPYMEGNFSLNAGYNNFKFFVKHLLYRNIANYDSMILLTGTKGSGKSSAAIMLAKMWCKQLGIQFSPKRHIAYNNADLMAKIDNLHPFEPIICDEAIRFASAADWARKENKQLKKKLAQVRTKHLFYILCFPLKIYKVESTYLQSFVNFWVDVYTRGQGIIFLRDSNPVSDSWRLRDFTKVGNYNEFTSPEKIREKLSKHPNFWSTMRIPKVPEKLYADYLNVREQNVYNDSNVLSNVGKEDIFNALLILSLRDIMEHDSTLSINRILLHIKNEYDLFITKAQINERIDDAKQLIQKIKEQAIDLNEFEKFKNVDEVQTITPVEGDDIEDIEDINENVKQTTLEENA